MLRHKIVVLGILAATVTASAALRRLALKAAIGNAPYLPSGNLSSDHDPLAEAMAVGVG